jgi:hypothetical protein
MDAMSAVRMCDRCGVIFSESAEGWGVGTISTNKRNERTGKLELVQQTIDLCPTDNRGPTEHLTPATVASITGGIPGVAEAERLSHLAPHSD